MTNVVLQEGLVTVPNFLTLMRIVLAPLICLAISWETPFASYVAFALFSLAGLTDFMDGYVAHKTNSRSELGALLDPLADKILVTMVFFFLAGVGRVKGMLLWPCAIIIGREIVISGLRGWVGAHRVPVKTAAKWKTGCQMIAGAGLLLPKGALENVVHFFVWISAALSLYSAYLYFQMTFFNPARSS